MRFLKTMLLGCAVALFLSGISHAGVMKPATSHAPTSFTGMFALYQDNRVQGTGNYVTADFLLTSYNLLLEKVAGDAEEQEILPRLTSFAGSLYKQLAAAPANRPGRERALRFTAVLNGLLTGNAPAGSADAVKQELQLIARHAAVGASPVSGNKEDYTQYVPRGRYTRSPALGRYFLASLYAGRNGFALRHSAATGVTPEMADEQTAAALLISRMILENDDLRTGYEQIERLLSVLAGASDDLSPAEMLDFADGAFGGMADMSAIRGKIITAARAANRMPRIIGGFVDTARLEPGVTAAEATISFRLLGQRFTPDSGAMQALVFNRVTTYQGTQTPFTLAAINGDAVRGFPTVFDLMAALGSRASHSILARSDDNNYKGYESGMKDAGKMMRRAAHNPKSLADMNLRLAYRLASMPGNDALNSAVGTWIQNRHAMVLYAKQSYTAVAKAIRLEPAYPARTDAYLEPMLDLYGDMIENLHLLQTVLESPALRHQVGSFAAIIRQAREVGYRQQEGELTEKDIAFLNDIDIIMKDAAGDKDRPLVVDIHTEPTSGLVVETGIGFPLAATYKGLRGGRFNCYEFKHPMDKRLTDEAWLAMLKAGQQPRSITEIIFRTMK